MRIVIDMQGVQTESRFRGIGRYTISFAQAIARNRGEHEVILALSGLFPDTIEPIRAAFDGLLPQGNIRTWYAPGPVMEAQPDNDARREVAELIREAFLARFAPDVIHLSSLFEGYVDNGVTSIGRFDRSPRVSVSLYDLIPLLNADQFLKPDPQYARYYRRKIEHLKNAAMYLAISESSRQEGLAHLDAAETRIVNVSTAIDSHFQPRRVDAAASALLCKKYGLTRPFVLYMGGSDERKNLPRLIQAFATLPTETRLGHQLLLAGKMPAASIEDFNRRAIAAGLKPGELQFTGYVSEEELVQLYNLCQLVVFPSWHEGFGLPVLEGMACGAAVIGSNRSSVPELIGMDAALFDPFDVTAIATKMAQALADDDFRAMLRKNGLQQAKRFSWDESAKRAINAWQSLGEVKPQTPRPNRSKLKLAFVSPLPPERTGIADYSAELLPALAEYYDIEVVVAQNCVAEPWVNRNCTVRDVSWLRSHAHEVDRVIYQVGNSPFHQHMLSLLREIPGTIVLHDFYLSGLLSWLEVVAGADRVWTEALYQAHGYGAVRDRYGDAEHAKRTYPANFQILRHALGVIVHSEYSKSLAQEWYGEEFEAEWDVIPLLRTPANKGDKATAREALCIDENDFLVCSFGYLDSTKLNHRLLDAWLSSALAGDMRCTLVFVGENHGGDYGADLLKTIRSNGMSHRIRITGFASPEMFRQYLMAADVAVQLRTCSRGETSAAVADCMNHGLPVIVNANGSMAELDSESVWMLSDEFDDAALVDALERLWREPDLRRAMSERARNVILGRHAPTECARRYAEAIERFHRRGQTSARALSHAIAADSRIVPNDFELVRLAKAVAATLPVMRQAKRLLLDVSATHRNDLKTGIERVARALTMAFLEEQPTGFRVEPIYLSAYPGGWRYRFARRYTLELLGLPSDALDDEIVDPQSGDLLLTLDLSGNMLVEADEAGLLGEYRSVGAAVYAVVFDLLPVRMPQVFPPGADQSHARWLSAISKFDGAVCISKAVADDLGTWYSEMGIDWKDRRPFRIGWFPLGADIANSSPSRGRPGNSESVLRQLRRRPTFLMVGTIEPRKGYLQTIKAFDQLWSAGVECNLVIVGREGWKDLPNDMRRDIPETLECLRSHPELQTRLFWLEGVSDDYLEAVYAHSTCLIAASFGEGFGLPLVEAARHGLPIIARDIRVFREVAGEHAFYFNTFDSAELAAIVSKWLALSSEEAVPLSKGLRRVSWEESARRLVDFAINNKSNSPISLENMHQSFAGAAFGKVPRDGVEMCAAAISSTPAIDVDHR